MKLTILLVLLVSTVVYPDDDDSDSSEEESLPVDCDNYVGDDCCYNGVIYKKTTSWPSERYCLQVTCYGKNHTIVVGCKQLPNDGCSSGYNHALQFPDCCPVRVCEIVKVADLAQEPSNYEVMLGQSLA